MDKFIVEIAEGSNVVTLNVDYLNYTQTKFVTDSIDCEELISRKGDCTTHILIIQNHDFAEIWKKLCGRGLPNNKQ